MLKPRGTASDYRARAEQMRRRADTAVPDLRDQWLAFATLYDALASDLERFIDFQPVPRSQRRSG
jgi:hypothetical protein